MENEKENVKNYEVQAWKTDKVSAKHVFLVIKIDD